MKRQNRVYSLQSELQDIWRAVRSCATKGDVLETEQKALRAHVAMKEQMRQELEKLKQFAAETCRKVMVEGKEGRESNDGTKRRQDLLEERIDEMMNRVAVLEMGRTAA